MISACMLCVLITNLHVSVQATDLAAGATPLPLPSSVRGTKFRGVSGRQWKLLHTVFLTDTKGGSADGLHD